VVYHHVATAVQGVSLQVPDRSIVTLLGTNGAGKTTTLRAISGFLGGDEAQVVAGRIAFRGETITDDLVSFGGRTGGASFRAPDPKLLLDRILPAVEAMRFLK